MCTLIVAWQVFDAPLVVAANRDERYDRPATAPREVGDERRIVAPLDEEAGGTWIGYNDAGLVVALTNRWVETGEGDRSRGLLVRDALSRPSAEAAARSVERNLDARDYEGFNLLLADADAAILVEYDGTPRVRRLSPGVHVVMNVGVDDDYFVPAVERLRDPAERQAQSGRRLFDALQPRTDETADEWRDRAAALLADHDTGVCVHGDGFGTRSSSLLTVRGAGDVEYLFAPGAPCETAYEPVDAPF